MAHFDEVFVGGQHAHGIWDPITGNAKTEHSPASPEEYQLHLQGKLGLGLVPIREDATCRFAAIDIDIDTINHADLFDRIRQRKIPLYVCRSKSGAAHCYLFMEEPGMPAARVIQVMKKWSAILGYPRAEIFPKQPKVSKSNIGNWINLPYFGGDNTTRYAIGPNGAMGLDEFLQSVTYWDGNEKIADETIPKNELVQIGDMPPCLASLTTEGIPEGSRNAGLFNIAAFYKRASPNGWEDKVAQYNQNYVKPPLPFREVQSIIRSVSQRKYQYTCEQEPICSRCDKATCVTLRYGILNEPWKDNDNFDSLQVGNCRKITTDPPRYVVEVNGNDIELSTKELLKFPYFRDRVFEMLDIIVAPQKQNFWEQQIRELMSKKTDIDAPKDASHRGMILDKLNEFLCLHERSFGVEDLLKGVPVIKEDTVYFRISDLQRYFQNQRIQAPDNNVLYQILQGIKCTFGQLRVKGKVISVWKLPKTFISQQTEEFTPATFKEFDEAEI